MNFPGSFNLFACIVCALVALQCWDARPTGRVFSLVMFFFLMEVVFVAIEVVEFIYAWADA